VLLGQALRAVAMTETEVSGAVNGSDELALKAEIVQGFHADEPLEVLPEQQREGWAADMADQMIEGPSDRESFLVGAGQAVEIVEDGTFEVAQVVIGGAAAAQAQPEEEHPPPAEEAPVVIDHGLEAYSMWQTSSAGISTEADIGDNAIPPGLS